MDHSNTDPEAGLVRIDGDGDEPDHTINLGTNWPAGTLNPMALRATKPTTPPDEQPNGLIIGPTGVGKSPFAAKLCAQIAADVADGATLVLIDPKDMT